MIRKIFVAVLGIISLTAVMSFTTTEQEKTGRRFWGWSEWNCSKNDYVSCCIRTHYILWMENAYEVQCD